MVSGLHRGDPARFGRPLRSLQRTNYYHCGLTVIHWAINSQTAAVYSSSQTYETNTILNSFHPGGIEGTLADGSVRFLDQTMDMEVLRRLGSADDGRIIGNY